MSHVRAATLADMKAVVDMSRRFYKRTHYAEFIPFEVETVAERASDLIRNHVFLIAERDGDAVGMVGLYVAPFMFNATYHAGYEVAWWVDESARGGLTAWRLLQALEAPCAAAGCAYVQMIHLETSPPAAHRLYERAGYARVESSYIKRIQ